MLVQTSRLCRSFEQEVLFRHGIKQFPSRYDNWIDFLVSSCRCCLRLSSYSTCSRLFSFYLLLPEVDPFFTQRSGWKHLPGGVYAQHWQGVANHQCKSPSRMGRSCQFHSKPIFGSLPTTYVFCLILLLTIKWSIHSNPLSFTQRPIPSVYLPHSLSHCSTLLSPKLLSRILSSL